MSDLKSRRHERTSFSLGGGIPQAVVRRPKESLPLPTKAFESICGPTKNLGRVRQGQVRQAAEHAAPNTSAGSLVSIDDIRVVTVAPATDAARLINGNAICFDPDLRRSNRSFPLKRSTCQCFSMRASGSPGSASRPAQEV